MNNILGSDLLLINLFCSVGHKWFLQKPTMICNETDEGKMETGLGKARMRFKTSRDRGYNCTLLHEREVSVRLNTYSVASKLYSIIKYGSVTRACIISII